MSNSTKKIDRTDEVEAMKEALLQFVYTSNILEAELLMYFRSSPKTRKKKRVLNAMDNMVKASNDTCITFMEE